MEIHDNDGDWTCPECSYQTNTEPNLKRHKLTAHPKNGGNETSQGGGQGAGRIPVTPTKIRREQTTNANK